LWNAIFKKEPLQVILSSSENTAEDILENIKAEIEENVLIYEDFGDLKTERWRKDEIKLKNGAVIVSKGINSSIRGLRKREHRPTLVLLDDVMKDETAFSPSLREKLYRKFKRAILPLGKDALIIVTNTILHNDDLPSRLLKEIEEGRLPDWVGLRFSAITPSGAPLWPSYWPLEKLERKKLEIGSVHFATEYMNEPLSDEDRLFKEEWITYYDSELPPLEELQISVGVDPATGKQHGDFSAIVVVGKDKRGVIYVLYTYIRKVSPTALMEELFRVYQQFKPRVIVFEEVAFQEVFKKWILEEGSKRGLHLPVKGVKPKGSKEVRATALAPLMENGLLKFKENQKELLEQLLTFPKGTHDDAVDALVYAVQGLEGSVLPIAKKVRSPFHYQTAFVRKTLNWLKGLP
jgi:predicted phage terminase large subunit-like protein